MNKKLLSLARNAFLSLIILNIGGWADRLHKARFDPLVEQRLINEWQKNGGVWNDLANAIEKGRKKENYAP